MSLLNFLNNYKKRSFVKSSERISQTENSMIDYNLLLEKVDDNTIKVKAVFYPLITKYVLKKEETLWYVFN